MLSKPETRRSLRPLRARGAEERRLPTDPLRLRSRRHLLAPSSATTCSAAAPAGAGGARGADVPAEVEIELVEAANGTAREIPFPSHVLLSCRGTGLRRARHPTCADVRRSRPAQPVSSTVFGQFVRTQPCPDCRGSGADRRQPCDECRGEGRRRAAHAQRRDPGGNPRRPADPALRRGPLRAGGRSRRRRLRARAREPRRPVRARGQRHRLRGRHNDDAGGARRDADRADAGRRRRARLRARAAAGRRPLLRGSGMPVLQGFGRGDHRVLVNVLVPRRLTDEQRALLERSSRPPARTRTAADEGLFDRLRSRSADRSVTARGRDASRPIGPKSRARRCSSSPRRVSRRSSTADGSSSPRTRTRAARSSIRAAVRRRVLRTGRPRLGGRVASVPSPGSRRAALARAAVGAPTTGQLAVVIDPGRAFGTGATRPRGSASSFCRARAAREPGGCRLRVGCRSRSPPRGSGSRRWPRSTCDPEAIEVDARQRGRERPRAEVDQLGRRVATRSPGGPRRREHHARGRSSGSCRRLDGPRARHLRLPRRRAAQAPRFRRVTRRELDGWAADLW